MPNKCNCLVKKKTKKRVGRHPSQSIPNVKLSNYAMLISTFSSVWSEYDRASLFGGPDQGLPSPTPITSLVFFFFYQPLDALTFLHLHHDASFIPSLINYLQGRARCKQPYLQRWKQSEVNNEAGLPCFMCQSEIATWLKSQLGESQQRSLLSRDSSWNLSCCCSCQQDFALAKHPFTADSLHHVCCPLSRCLSLHRDHYKCN